MSYCYPVPVASAFSEASGELELVLHKGEYRLSTSHAVYSHGIHYTNFRQYFKRHATLLPEAPFSLLVLGFGLGSVPLILERLHGRTFTCTGVERDPAIAAWATRFTLPRLRTQVELIVSDALDFLTGNRRRFDLLVVDIFIDDQIPKPFLEEGFLRQLKTALSVSGLVLYNCLYLESQDQKATNRFFEQVFQAVFPEGNLAIVAGNAILSSR
ncbi:MAG: hypothetical protein RLY31_1527 [Bacteroidota bacterium]